jgi:hypothetical protein
MTYKRDFFIRINCTCGEYLQDIFFNDKSEKGPIGHNLLCPKCQKKYNVRLQFVTKTGRISKRQSWGRYVSAIITEW